ncbi:hypothetical protein KJ855_03520 [Patescibacteria group bacterium]|nr:hypothetical protein [Patescibacteria group bacterium]
MIHFQIIFPLSSPPKIVSTPTDSESNEDQSGRENFWGRGGTARFSEGKEGSYR